MNEPNQVSDGRVYAGDQVWPNIFEAVGFPPEEAARMLAAVDAEIDARRRQARVFLAAAGKPSALAGPGTRPARTRVVNDGCRVGRQQTSKGGRIRTPNVGLRPRPPGGSCAPPRRFRALARSDAGSPPALPTRREGGGLSDRVGEGSGGRVRLSTGEAKRSRWAKAAVHRWNGGAGPAPGDPAGVVSAPPRS